MKKIIAFLYQKLLKPILFLFDPEWIHDLFIKIGKFLGEKEKMRKICSFLFAYQNEKLGQKILGLEFKNPIGLAGGFDKNADLTEILPEVGFGFMELGSITQEPYAGNSGKRLMRFPKTGSLWVNYGLKNIGSKAISRKLASKKFQIPAFINIAKTNNKECSSRVKGVSHYYEATKDFLKIADAYTINISCPNTFGGQPFHNERDLKALLSKLDKLHIKQPVFIKISPEISKKETDKILSVCDKHKVDGIIISNLRKQKKLEEINYQEREKMPEHGGLSGKYLQQSSDEMLKYIARKVKKGKCKKYVLIGLGGVFDAKDAYKKIKLGASLVQLITGMIFKGPQLIGQINKDLVKLLEQDGYKNITEAIGADIH